eukprot:jgi/Undpi1/6067/HiC_scaffold_20.g08552.m1
MDYGATGQDGLNLFDPDLAVDMNSLQTLPTLPRINVDWDGGFPELSNQQPAAPPVGAYPPPAAMAFPNVADGIGYGTLCVPGAGAFDVLAGASSSNNNNGGGKAEDMLAIAHNSTRAARNGREQQRAQKISDVIDKLKASRGHRRSFACHRPTVDSHLGQFLLRLNKSERAFSD